MLALNIFSGILAFFFSITSFFTVTTGGHRADFAVDYDEATGLVWECDIQNDNIAFVYKENTRGKTQTFTFEATGEGRTYAVLTAENGETKEVIIDCYDQINPYNGKHVYYQALVYCSSDEFIDYEENITMTPETPVEGAYWIYSTNFMEVKSDSVTKMGICEYDVINTYGEDIKCDTLFTYVAEDGTPLEMYFQVFTLTADGKIIYAPEESIAIIDLPSDTSKYVGWIFSGDDGYTGDGIIRICGSYVHSDTYGSFYIPDYIDENIRDSVIVMLDYLLGKVPVEGHDSIVLEAIAEGTTEFKLSKVDMCPFVKTADGYEIVVDRCEVLETVTVVVTVDKDLNISYEIK